MRQLLRRFSKPTRHANPWPTAFRHNRDTLDTGRPIGRSLMPNLLGERFFARPCRAKRRRRIGERVEPERPQEETFADTNAPYFPMAGHVRASSSMQPDCPLERGARRAIAAPARATVSPSLRGDKPALRHLNRSASVAPRRGRSNALAATGQGRRRRFAGGDRPWRVHSHSTQEARWQRRPSIAERPGSGCQAQSSKKRRLDGGARRLGARGLVKAGAPVTIRETEW